MVSVKDGGDLSSASNRGDGEGGHVKDKGQSSNWTLQSEVG